MLEYLRNNRIMVVVAHPDDEILGVGGTINLLVKLGASVKVLILGEGLTGRSQIRDLKQYSQKLKTHKKDILAAKKCLGYQELSTYDLPDNRFDTVPLLDIIKIIEKEKEKFKPEVIFTHHMGDVNIDHQKTFDAVLTAVRPIKDESVKTLVSFETLSGTEWISSSDPRKFSPNFFVSLHNDELEQKVAAMSCYRFEKRSFPHPRSQESLRNRAKMWGITVGKEYVESFQIIRTIQ